MESHLLQMRGLKLNENHRYKKGQKSHLLQMRGLKQKRCATGTGAQVASFTDAWIETRQHVSCAYIIKSHLLQMRGLKRDYK